MSDTQRQATNKVISVIIPIYNAEKTICRALDSIYHQSYPYIELLCIDDCSSDNSAQVIKTYKDQHQKVGIETKLIQHQQNRGVAAARNTGLDNATGDYIIWLDADDYLALETFENLIFHTIKQKTEIVAFGFITETTSGSYASPLPSFTTPIEAFRLITIHAMKFCQVSFMVKRSIYETHKLRFFEGDNMGEDFCMICRVLLLANSIYRDPNSYYHYVMDSSSMTHNYNEARDQEVINNLNHLETFIVEKFGANSFNTERNCFQLIIKSGMLRTDNVDKIKAWVELFPNSNRFIWRRPFTSIFSPKEWVNRMMQQMAIWKQYWFVKIMHNIWSRAAQLKHGK